MSETRGPSGSTSLPLGDRKEAWDAGAAKKALDPGQYGSAFFWRDPNGDPKTLAAYKLPFASPSGSLHAVWAGVTAAAAAIQGSQGGVQLPSGDVAGVKAKIAAYYAKARKKYNDDSIVVPWASQSSARQGYQPEPYTQKPDETVECPECDAMNDTDADYCDQCGCPLAGRAEVEGNTAHGALRFAVAPITHVDVRDASASHGFWTMSGYAAVFNRNATMYDGKLLRLTESIHPDAFQRVLRDQNLGQPDGVVHFNLGHDMNRSVAATDVPAGQPGSLQLRADDQGLFFLAKVPHDDPDGVAMAAKMRSGVLRQASFAFTVGKDEVNYTTNEDGPDTEHRTILDVKRLYDVCATPQGAYAQTVVGLRSLAAALGEPHGHPLTHQPVSGDEQPVSPQGDGAATANTADLEKFRRATEAARAFLRDLPSRKEAL